MEKYDRKIKNGSGFTPEKEPTGTFILIQCYPKETKK